jgi:adenylosuccinate synthase
MYVDVVLGLQWGDEGKGKIVDALTPRYQWVARFQGGPNAGHTLWVEGKKYVLHTIPSGIVQPDCRNVIGSGVLIDPIVLKREIQMLEQVGIPVKERLLLSSNAHLILPVHRLLDRVREEAKGSQKIGSTLKGIGPAYQDLYAREGLRVCDIFSQDFEHKYHQNHRIHVPEIQAYTAEGTFQDEQLFRDAVAFLRDYSIGDTSVILNRALVRGETLLAEGAQGTLLDIGFGTYPYVTSSHTISGAACTGLGIPPTRIRKVYGIFKAYATRVGNGPFSTELKDGTGERLRAEGQEYGATTGRPRRCGWLDLPALRYACTLNGVTDLVMTKGDILHAMPEVQVCDTYLDPEGQALHLPTAAELGSAECRFRSFSRWARLEAHYKQYQELPEAFRTFIEYIETQLELPIRIVSTGPGREEMIERAEADALR